MNDDDLFDNGIDGEPFESPADDYYEEYYRESFDVVNANGLEIQGWPTYGNYTIITSLFHVYYWPGNNTLDIHSKDPNARCSGPNDRLLLTLKNHDLYFFGEKTSLDEDGKWNVDWYTGEQIDQKIQRYLNLKAFL